MKQAIAFIQTSSSEMLLLPANLRPLTRRAAVFIGIVFCAALLFGCGALGQDSAPPVAAGLTKTAKMKGGAGGMKGLSPLDLKPGPGAAHSRFGSKLGAQ